MLALGITFHNVGTRSFDNPKDYDLFTAKNITNQGKNR